MTPTWSRQFALKSDGRTLNIEESEAKRGLMFTVVGIISALISVGALFNGRGFCSILFLCGAIYAFSK